MALDAAEAMLLGRLQQSVEGLERVTESLRLAIHELREALADGQQTHEARIIALETGRATDKAHKAGMVAGFTVGQKVGLAALFLSAAWGVKSGAVDLAKLVLSLGK